MFFAIFFFVKENLVGLPYICTPQLRSLAMLLPYCGNCIAKRVPIGKFWETSSFPAFTSPPKSIAIS